MGYNDRNSQGRQPNRNASRPPRQVTARPLPANYVDEAERVIRSLYDERNKISTNKIRNLLSLVTDIYNDESIRTEDKLKPDSVVKLNLMRVRVAYEYGRDNGESVGKDKVYPMKEFITQAHLREYLKGISTDRADLIRFAHYMEALVAFHRYLGGKEN